MDNVQTHKFNLSDKMLSPQSYKFNRNPPKSYNLYDNIVYYNDGFNTKIVPLNIAKSFPIIYDTYTQDEQVFNDLTIVICPFTLSTYALEGKYKLTQYVDGSFIVIIDSSDKLISLRNLSELKIKKFDVSIGILRNIFTTSPNCKYMVLDKSIGQEPEPILGSDYYTGKQLIFDELAINKSRDFHPKMLAHIIIYKSIKDSSEKSTILVGVDSSPDEISGYNIGKSGVYKYLNKYYPKIREKFGIVVPCLWFAALTYFPNAKIILL